MSHVQSQIKSLYFKGDRGIDTRIKMAPRELTTIQPLRFSPNKLNWYKGYV